MKIKGVLEIVDSKGRSLIQLGDLHGRPYLCLRAAKGKKLLAWVTVDADGNLDIRDFSPRNQKPKG